MRAEALGRALEAEHAHLRPLELGVHPRSQRLQVEPHELRADDLTDGVHALVGAAGARPAHLLQRAHVVVRDPSGPVDRRLERLLHRHRARVLLQTLVARAAVRKQQRNLRAEEKRRPVWPRPKRLIGPRLPGNWSMSYAERASHPRVHVAATHLALGVWVGRLGVVLPPTATAPFDPRRRRLIPPPLPRVRRHALVWMAARLLASCWKDGARSSWRALLATS